jgi:hypothetical protein
MKFIKLFTLFIFTSLGLFAQMPDSPKESANILHQNGQIYLVVLVLVTIFAGIIFMLVKIEKKLSTLEKNK